MKRVDPSVYTKDYYLTDCNGYAQFKKTHGSELGSDLKRVSSEIPSPKDLTILDIGCGRGEMCFWAAKNGAKKVVGIDYSKDAIDIAKIALLKQPSSLQKKISFRHMDAKKLELKNNTFDGIIMIEVLEHLYLPEQNLIFKQIKKVLKKTGFVFIHTAPSRIFNDYTYPFYCYPMSSLFIFTWKLLTGKKYPNILHPKNIRTDSHAIMHVNEPDYLSLRKLFSRHGFSGKIFSTNLTVKKPEISWKDKLFNLLVYLHPFSNHFPLNVLWGNDFVAVLKLGKKK